MKRILALFVIALLLVVWPGAAVLAMTSTNYQIPWDTVAEGGSEAGTSTNYSIHDTVGNQAAGTSTSSNYELAAGYRVGESSTVLSLVVRSQDSSTQVAWSAFSDGGLNVVVASPAGYAIGDAIAVVENIGFSQRTAVGRIASIGGSTLTVDAWSGDNAVISGVAGGGNDYVYRLSSTAAAFGNVTSTNQNTNTAYTNVLSDAPAGFSVFVQANQVLQNGSAQPIATVTDGTVTFGSEEYGASVTGPNAVGSGDLGVTTTQRLIQNSGTPAPTTPDRVAMVYKLAITGSTNSGTYSQNVFYTLTANY